jgi:flagellar basal body-associated protein FliL
MSRAHEGLAKELPIDKTLPSVSALRHVNCFSFRVAEAKQAAVVSEQRGRGIWIFLSVVVLAFVGWWWNTQRGTQGQGMQEFSPVRSTVHLETFVLNLADHEQRSYLRVGIDLGISRELKHGEDPPIAHMRDTILAVLSTAKADDLLTAEGKTKLKAELLQALKERVPQMGVHEVYFTEFLIQR